MLLTLSGGLTDCLVVLCADGFTVDSCYVFLLVVIPVPVTTAYAVYPRVADFTVLSPPW